MAYYKPISSKDTPEKAAAHHARRASELDNFFQAFEMKNAEISPLARLQKLYETKFCSDVTLVLKKNGSSFRAHKFVLSFTSSVLATLVAKDASIDQYELDYDPQAFEWFLKHSYNVTTSFPAEHLAIREIYDLLRQLEMFEVLKALREFIGTLFTSDSVETFYQLAMDFKDAELQSKCFKYVGEYCCHIVQEAPAGKLSSRVLKLAVSQEHLDYMEIEIFEIVVQWAKKKLEFDERELTGENIRATMRPILAEIDFLNIDVPDLMLKVYNESIFTDLEIQAILQLSWEVNTKPISEVRTFPNYPKDLNPNPRTRNFIKAEDTFRRVHLITNEVCNYKTVWYNANAMELMLFQVNKSILVFEVKAKLACHIGNCHVEIRCNGKLLGKSAIGINRWIFDNPIQIAKNETYNVIMMGLGKISNHSIKMFTVTNHEVVFSGKSLYCNISMLFKLKTGLNHK